MTLKQDKVSSKQAIHVKVYLLYEGHYFYRSRRNFPKKIWKKSAHNEFFIGFSLFMRRNRKKNSQK